MVLIQTVLGAWEGLVEIEVVCRDLFSWNIKLIFLFVMDWFLFVFTAFLG